MKIKILLIILLMCISSTSLYSQEMYLHGNIGYGFPATKTVIGARNDATFIENVYGSWGAGLNLGAAIGAMFSEHVGAELGFSFLSGREYQVSSTDTLGALSEEASATMLRLIPALRISGGEKTKVYSRIGFVLGVSASWDETFAGSIYGVPISGTATAEGGTAFGWTAAAGVSFSITDKSAFFAELYTINMNWAPEEMKVYGTGFSYKLNFRDKVNANNAYEELKDYMPFNSTGVNLGIIIMLGK